MKKLYFIAAIALTACNMPNKGKSKGRVLSINNEPCGLNGAKTVSHARHKAIRAIKLVLAPNLSARILASSSVPF